MRDWRADIEQRLPPSAVTTAQNGDLLNELAQHLEDRFDELRHTGLDADEARRLALAELDHSEQLVRELQLRRRHVSPPPLGDSRPTLTGDLWLDIKFGLRMLRKTPGFTAVAALTLALGIGANTAIFTVINAAMLRPLPFADAERLIRIYEANPAREWLTFGASYPNYLDWVEQARAFDMLSATTPGNPTLMDGGQAERVSALLATHSFLPMLGVTPLLGRNFEAAEDRPGGDTRVAVLTFGYWQRRFGGNPATLGSTIVLNDRPYTVIGILPEAFRWGPTLDMVLPLAPDPARDRGDHRLSVFGRVQRGVSHDQAAADLVAIAARLEEQFPQSNAGWTVRTVSFYDWIVPAESRRSLQMIGMAVIAVLLIACGNVASLLLARATTRHKEITVRVALGARRGRVVRQLVVESVLLSMVAGGAGLLLAYGTTALLKRMNPEALPRLDEISVDTTVLAYGFLLACGAGVLCGIAPALSGLRVDATESLKEAGRGGGTGPQRQRLRSALVIGELALSVVLLVGAGMLMRSFWQVQKVDPGFDPSNLLTLRINLPLNRYDTQREAWAFYEQLLSGIASLPGVRATATTSAAPMSTGNTSTEVRVPGRMIGNDNQAGSADWRLVSPGYFRVMGITLRGREFAADDAGDRDRVAIVSESFAQRYFPGEDPIGRAVSLSSGGSDPRIVIGVARDVRSFGLDAVSSPMVYFPAPSAASGWPLMTVVVRTQGPPAELAASVRGVLRSLDASIPFYNVATAEELLETSMGPRRFVMSLLAGFAAVAAALASVGLFGVMAYLVSQRAREIGIRLALGARPADVRRSIVGRGLALASAGAALGVVSAYWLSPVMESFLFEVKAVDPIAFVGAPLMLVAVALVASYLPARRAMRVDPITALRDE